MNKYYKCIKCKKTYPFNKDVFTCDAHSPYYGYLTLMYDYKKVKIKNNQSSWSKYLDLLPIDNFKIHFNEQKTPLFKLKNIGNKYNLTNLFLKDESKNPTGSFKDKETICAINKAIEWNIKKIFIVSSGNAAVSAAAYAQKAGIECLCLVPKNMSVGKRFLINLYGGKIKEIDGNYEEIYRYAIDNNFPGWNTTPGINPIKEEGIKIIGFEIWEDINVPDVVMVPCGNGTLLFGIYKAFKELQYLGLIKKLPKFIGVQIKNASPLKLALDQDKEFVRLEEVFDSIAEGIIAQESYSSPKVMMALNETKGQIIEVDDKEITEALEEVTKMESLIPEITSVSVFAALKKIKFNKNETIVLVQTAGGMKNLKEIMGITIKNNS